MSNPYDLFRGRPDWMADASCLDTDPEAFFPEKGACAVARRVCLGCPVKAECLAYALANDERFGVWGGLTENQRAGDAEASMTRDNRAYLRDYYDRYERAARGHRPLHPAGPVADHIAACVALGMSRRSVAIAAHVSEATVGRITRNPELRVRESVAARILAVPARRPVTAIGVRRRLWALAALGWSTGTIAATSGINVDTVKEWRRGEHTDPSGVAERIVSTYAELSMRLPDVEGRYERAAVSQVRARAARNRWAPPLAWDDDTIDDPAATPDLGATVRGVDLDEWLWLVHAGENPTVAARRCGVGLSAIERAAHRAGRRDVLALVSTADYSERRTA